jgi:HK97 family phage major capsid protein
MTLKEKREQRGKLAADMQALIPKEGRMSAENQTKFDAMDVEQEALKEEIVREEKSNALDTELRASRKPPETEQPGGAKGTEAEQQEERKQKHQKAFRSYLIHGKDEITDEERKVLSEYRDMGTGGGNALQGSGGGYFVPVAFVNEIEQGMKYYGDMLNVAKIMNTATGQPLPYPISDDTGTTGELVGENVQVTIGDVTLGSIVFGAYKFSTKMVKVSMELLQDSAFDIESFLKEQFSIRLGRVLNTKFTVGTGTAEPKGIITAAASSGVTVTGDDNATTPAPTVEVGYLDLVALEHSVDILYRRGAKFMFHDTTLRFLKQLKDKYGRPLWVPGMATNAPDTINGYPYSINNDMDQLAASKKTVAFGLLDKYLIRRVRELAVLRLIERYADQGQVAFVGFARYDGNLLDPATHPVKYLTQHA